MMRSVCFCRFLPASVCWFVLLALLAGCGTRQATRPEEKPMPETATLLNTYWRVVEIDGRRVVFGSGQKMDTYFQLSRSGRLKGATGCNYLNGSYRRAGDRFAFRSMSTTRMVCSRPVMAQEKAFLDAAVRTVSFTLRGRELRLFDSRGNKVLECLAVYPP